MGRCCYWKVQWPAWRKVQETTGKGLSQIGAECWVAMLQNFIEFLYVALWLERLAKFSNPEKQGIRLTEQCSRIPPKTCTLRSVWCKRLAAHQLGPEQLRKDMTRDAVEIDSSEVQLPEWLRDRESQLNGFVHPGTADGLMKAPQSKWTQHLPHGISLITASEACHKQLHGMLSNQALEKEAKMMKMYSI